MRRDAASFSHHQDGADGSDDCDAGTYLTYRPLSNLPTPPPSYKECLRSSTTAAAPGHIQRGEAVKAKFRGPAIHLVNLIPSSASFTAASVAVVQAMLSRADLPVETVALAVCILDSLDKKFARVWRVSCPLLPGTPPINKRHSLPLTPQLYQQRQHQMLHIDSVPPEIIILAALVIAVKFTQDPQQVTQYYCEAWGCGTWSHQQLNATERCIMDSLEYRILPLCNEDCLTQAMVDMQLAGRQTSWESRELSPPNSMGSAEDDEDADDDNDDEKGMGAGHSRPKAMTMSDAGVGLGLGLDLSLTPMDSPCLSPSQPVTEQAHVIAATCL